jgi:serine/threonine protein kinase
VSARREAPSDEGRLSSVSSESRSAAGPKDGKYKLLAELGRGGMANVYLAVARGPSGFNKLVVLKCLRSDLADDKDLLTMFLEEARVAARLNHPHVVQTYEVGDYAGRPVIVMEYLEGQTLSNLVQRARAASRLPLALHLRVLVDALEGLHHAHELADFSGKRLDLVHRDVSPQNVFVTFDGQVKVLDFGIAKVVNSQAQTSTGILKGKIHYMAPEQMLCTPVDRRADLYAAGVMTWEAATGKRMWKDFTDLQVMNKVTNDGAPSPREVDPTVSPALEGIIMKALARNPDDRYATALEFAGAIESFMEQTGTGASNRGLAKLMRELFEDARKETRAIIEAQLLEVGSTDHSQPMIPPNLVRISMRPEESPPLGTGGNTIQTATADKAYPQKRRFAVPMAGAIVVASMAIGLVLWSRAASRPAVTPASTINSATQVATIAPTSATSAAPAPSVTLSLSTTPKRATLYLDGHALANNPHSAVVPMDSAVHAVRAEAPGYLPKTVMVTPDHDTDVVVALEPVAVRVGPRTTPAASSSTQTAAPPNNGGNASNNKCNPPYFIDSDGIKKFRPECL